MKHCSPYPNTDWFSSCDFGPTAAAIPSSVSEAIKSTAAFGIVLLILIAALLFTVYLVMLTRPR